MSRLGKKPIAIPKDTEVSVAGRTLVVKGPHGTLSRTLASTLDVKVEAEGVEIIPRGTSLDTMMLWGTFASHIQNMLEGVNKPYQKKLLIEGVGYKAEVKGDAVVLSIGYSHPVTMKIPQGIKVTSDKGLITISGIDKDVVGEFAAKIRSKKKPEPYKGKGIRYETEVIRRKQGKKSI
ncbi:MAG: 50S ribosomal protein L6 [bacterium]|nr:50S ribosomal protein L6 [bacterium]